MSQQKRSWSTDDAPDDLAESNHKTHLRDGLPELLHVARPKESPSMNGATLRSFQTTRKPPSPMTSLEIKLDQAGALIDHFLVADAAREDCRKRRWEEGKEKCMNFSRTFHQRAFIEKAQYLAEKGVCEPDCEKEFCTRCANQRYVRKGGFSYTIDGTGWSSQVSEDTDTLEEFPIDMGLAFDLIREIYETDNSRMLLNAIKKHEFGKNVYHLYIEKKESISRNKDGLTLGGRAYHAKQGAIAKYGKDGINTISLDYRVVFLHYDRETDDVVRFCRTCWGNQQIKVEEYLGGSNKKHWTIDCPDCEGTGQVPANTYYKGGKETPPQ